MTAASAIGAAVRALALGVGLAGCLVTDKIEYTEQDLPPRITVIRPGPAHPFPEFSECVTTVASDGGIDNDQKGPWVQFEVNVSDPNIDDELQVVVLVNGFQDRLSSPPNGNKISPNGKVDRGNLKFCVVGKSLENDCNLVQLVVVSQNDADLNSEYGVDLAEKDKYDLQSWVVLGSNQRTPALCQLLDDAGVL